MNTNTAYNIDFLNNYFTSTEFNFINNANLENQKLDEIIAKETKTRDIIVNFINNLHEYISNSKATDSNKEFLALLTEVQEIFEKINNNIKIIQDLKDTSSKILDNIVELLIKIEQDHDNVEKYSTQIQDLREMINNFSIKNEDVKSKILLNDIKIDTFFQKNIVKKYLSSFDTEFHFTKSDLSKNSFTSSNLVKEEDNFETADMNKTSVANHEKNFQQENLDGKDTYQNLAIEIEDNKTLLVSEKLKKVFLPYTKHEISLYLEQYPDSYISPKDVIKKEFELSLDYYMKHPVVSRFREAYSLIRDRESKSIIDAFKFAIDIMFKYELNPVIIAACKTQEQLEHYLQCLEKNKLDEFKDFEIKFEIAPLGI